MKSPKNLADLYYQVVDELALVRKELDELKAVVFLMEEKPEEVPEEKTEEKPEEKKKPKKE